jgi:hypothetical protein
LSTIDHLIAQAGQLRAAWGWLAEATIPGRARRNQRVMSESATAKRDRQAAAERADRHKLLGNGKLVTGHNGAPANVNAIDAKEKISADVDHTAWVMASAMRDRGYNDLRQSAYRPGIRNSDDRFRTGIDWISMNAPRLQEDDRDTVNTAYRSLVDATNLATAVSGCGPTRAPMASECPACGRRSLARDVSSERYEEWHVVCTNPKCRCSGRSCGCNQPDRQFGNPHVWLESSWNRLAQQLEERA